MKRRKFLKTVSAVTSAAALGAGAAPTNKPASTSSASTGNPPGQAKKGRPTNTERLEEVTAGGPGSTAPTSTLRIRPPFWHPDGSPPDGNPPNVPADPGTPRRNQVFQEEVVGKHKIDQLMRPFRVEFDYTGTSKKWILGGKLAATPPKNEVLLTQLAKDLAVKVRRYNASLYRLRRIHYCNRYSDAANRNYWPPANPHGGDEPDPTLPGVPGRVAKAEQDWCKVTKDLDDFIESAKTTYSAPPNPNQIKLIGLDMVEVNNYVIAMRVVVEGLPGNTTPPEPGGSSSQVSVSSPLSSLP